MKGQQLQAIAGSFAARLSGLGVWTMGGLCTGSASAAGYHGESSDADEKRGHVCCSASMARKHDGEEGNGGQVYEV